MSKKIAIVCGARPNFMKVAPLCKTLKEKCVEYCLINTGQHFDFEMSQAFFDEFNIKPDYNLSPSKISAIKQFSDIICDLERIYQKEKIDLVVVVGDVNSTLAGAIVANKLNIKLVHIEAGLRSHNKSMPEEHNRVMVDHISDFLFTTTEDGNKNLKKEGIQDGMYFVGNIMIDTLTSFLPQVKSANEDYYFCTLHRAENIDNKEIFLNILEALEEISRENSIYLPLHPRTKKMAEKFNYIDKLRGIFDILPPLSYADSLFYQKNAKLILTDSGGIQEEASFLGVPCITLRKETERPITVELGTNSIGGVSKGSILDEYGKKRLVKKNITIPLWDGQANLRIFNIIKKSLL